MDDQELRVWAADHAMKLLMANQIDIGMVPNMQNLLLKLVSEPLAKEAGDSE